VGTEAVEHREAGHPPADALGGSVLSEVVTLVAFWAISAHCWYWYANRCWSLTIIYIYIYIYIYIIKISFRAFPGKMVYELRWHFMSEC
jgi:uncharacterized RDD family membrane protein YckC